MAGDVFDIIDWFRARKNEGGYAEAASDIAAVDNPEDAQFIRSRLRDYGVNDLGTMRYLNDDIDRKLQQFDKSGQGKNYSDFQDVVSRIGRPSEVPATAGQVPDLRSQLSDIRSAISAYEIPDAQADRAIDDFRQLAQYERPREGKNPIFHTKQLGDGRKQDVVSYDQGDTWQPFGETFQDTSVENRQERRERESTSLGKSEVDKALENWQSSQQYANKLYAEQGESPAYLAEREKQNNLRRIYDEKVKKFGKQFGKVYAPGSPEKAPRQAKQQPTPQQAENPTIVRTGTDKKTGKKVVMYSDGRVAYAKN